MKRIFASFGFLFFATFALDAQTTWFVTPGAPATGSGNSWANAIDLQTAINTASAGDYVFVAQGSYQRASGQSFSMKEGVMIYGGFQGTETTLGQRNLSAGYISTLRGNNTRVVSNISNGLSSAAVLDGFTISGGSIVDYGGGMLNQYASPTISNCIFSNNFGGGIWNAYSSATVIKCVFTGNTGDVVTYGGGISCASSNNASIINCIFVGNTGAFGGGVYIDDLGPKSPSVINCTFYGNIATTPVVGAGGIFLQSRASPTIQNCIIWGNNLTAIHTVLTSNPPVITNNIIQGGFSTNLKADPLFVNAGNPAGPDNIWGTADDGLMLQTGSPAYNAGTPDITGLGLPATDMAGVPRVQGGKIDIGAYESPFSCSAFTTVYVDSSISASGDGSSWATAFKTMDQGLLLASQCTNINTIFVAKGTYQPATMNSYSMMNNVQIYGGFPSGGGTLSQRDVVNNTSVLQGYNASVIYNSSLDNSALLDGFTITGGSSGAGAGMYNLNALPVINNCIFLGNAASSNGGTGGAIYNSASAPLINHCVFSGNAAATNASGGGGAIFNTNSFPTINNSVFYNNTASYGGAIFNVGSTVPTIRNSVFVANTSLNDGAAIGNYGTALTLDNVTFASNSAGGGGAIDNYQASLSVTNCLFWGNTANNNPDIWWENGNGGIAYSFTQTSFSGTGNMVGTASPFVNIAVPAGADGIWGTSDDGLALKVGSPPINAGTPDTTGMGLGSTDIAGNPRITGAIIDIGAYEYFNGSLPVTIISFTGTLNNGLADLQWSSGVESNFSHFEVEKSTNGSSFVPVGDVRGKGSSSSYVYNVVQPELAAFYRLKLVDNDGSAIYSRTIRLSQNAGNGIQVFPNPARNQVYVKVADAGNLAIYAADGKLVKIIVMQAGVNTVDVSGLVAGTYYTLINGMQATFIKL